MMTKATLPPTTQQPVAETKQQKIRVTSQQLLAAISLAGQIALNQPNPQGKTLQARAMEEQTVDLKTQVNQEEHQDILAKMVGFANRSPGHLEKEEELYLEQQLADMLGFSVSAELEGRRLNHSLGVMGGEQHLMRFPGDSLAQHDAYREAGLAPARGAFGWFTENGQLTQEAIAREKYYFAVQTLYLPTWNQEHVSLKPWYKFRKMIVINPAEAVAVVGVVGDAGPAQWVKKQFGGSPEIIREGKIWSPKTGGKIILWFVDDPENKVPLGPIDLNWSAKEAQANPSAEKTDDSS